ncbi:FkbM family methyltransferase [Ferrovum sp. PN-J185]|uniref:FkbM family methyltransferase n=1 Tax=Ferrovum sp. PN-J185 TaxID=1356306 RepID=UPI00079A2440|nr:FkbM family methyltransferase [Ferrovum sp. PN-J185]KXW55840.1 2-O-methyltransferase NoeI [Ferrovum sp. PN-J185]
MKKSLLHFGNRLYYVCYPVYSPLYTIYKVFSDRSERKFFRYVIKPGMNVVDVGSNIGIYTKYFSKLVGDLGSVHSFEPDPLNFKRLKENSRKFVNASLNHAAVGESNGTIKLYISDKLNVDHRTFDSGDGRRSIDVPVIALDSYFSPGQRVDFVKIDVQGFEWSVFQGAKRILTENKNIKILMEYWPWGLKKASSDHLSLIEFIESLGFNIFKISKKGIEKFNIDIDLDVENENDYINLIIYR